ncbi:hypothetical protein [Brevundimonas sp. LjRoot202]|uniref:hypothetical protein n=1 Tax=Brevundimonas sp. LjRoot202 TaxID=3342281 RepID=UPI003ED05053
MKFTNRTAGPKGVHTKKGLVYIEAGKSADLDVSEAEAAAAKATGWFSKPKVEDDDDGPKELGDMTVNELKALAEAETIDLGDATKKADIVAAIELAREAKAEA